MTLPNIFTIARIAVMPIFVIVFYLPYVWANWLCALLFAFAALTDFIDGYLARKLKQVSTFGQFFDPVADKLVVTIALVLLVGKQATALLAIPAAIILCREIGVMALRAWMAARNQYARVVVSSLGKAKTVSQMLAIFLLLLSHQRAPMGSWVVLSGYVLLYIATILTLWSMLLYFRAAWSSITQGNMRQE